MGLFGSKPSVLGVDIGTASVKAVLLRKRDGTFQLGALGEKTLRTSYLHDRGEKFVSETVNNLTQLFAEMRLKTKDLKKVVVGIPGNLAFSTVVLVPDGSWEQLNETVFKLAQQYVPADISTVSLSWVPLQTVTNPAGTGETLREVYLVAFAQEILQLYLEILSQVGNSSPFFELTAFGQARSLIGADPVNTLLVDIGSEVTELSVVEQGLVRVNRNIYTGGRVVSQHLMEKLEIEASEAERQKRERGLDRNFLLETVPQIIQQEIDKIALEIERIRKQLALSGKKLERMLILGGGAHIRDIDYYLGRKFSLPTFLAEPWQRVNYNRGQQQALQAKGPEYAAAVGLAMHPAK